jgi:SsrA-binding protein
MIALNRRARYEYTFIEEFDCGIILVGSEVKSVRMGNVTLIDAFIYIKDNEVWIKNLKIAPYKSAHTLDIHEENRDKKLLLNKKEIVRIKRKLEDKGITAIPLGMFVKNNKIKIKIAVAKGKKTWDKKEDIKARDIKLDLKRNLNINI